MPHVIVKLYPGRSEDQKINLAEKITSVVSESLNLSESSISVAIEEISRDDWAKEVYKKDIIENEKSLYKRPGYKPSEDELK
ncbi:4-oxalocrotonate tautomerase [Clostridium chromiireducens]|uniref:4-oxalocrotonate tautomerase n=1 Tax=Clostridium chromiireducens TaxID=225345 RepID=A0A399IQ61_9CLOT|nr:tautomerase family protein [Clostridium chromiireducens]RII35198.1 4-oxalocrotonate tautomerase [Clostridium chromiireducens]